MKKENKSYVDVQETIDVFEKLGPIFTAIGDVNRQKILVLLGRYDQMNVKDIHSYMTLSRPAISHHLKHLKSTGLIDHHQKGNENYYYLTMKSTLSQMKQLIKMIEVTCQTY